MNGTENGIRIRVGSDVNDSNIPVDVVLSMETGMHLLINGTSGSGKSVLLNGIISSLTDDYTSDDIDVYVIDGKGWLEGEWGNAEGNMILPVISHLVRWDEGNYAIASAISDIYTIAKYRMVRLMQNGYRTTKEWNRLSGEQQFEDVVVIVDEYQAIDQSGNLKLYDKMERILKLSRAAGIHFIFSSQSSAGVRNRFSNISTWNVFQNRICLHTFEMETSIQVIGTKEAVGLPRYGYGILQKDWDVTTNTKFAVRPIGYEQIIPKMVKVREFSRK